MVLAAQLLLLLMLFSDKERHGASSETYVYIVAHGERWSEAAVSLGVAAVSSGFALQEIKSPNRLRGLVEANVADARATQEQRMDAGRFPSRRGGRRRDLDGENAAKAGSVGHRDPRGGTRCI